MLRKYLGHVTFVFGEAQVIHGYYSDLPRNTAERIHYVVVSALFA